MSRHASGDAGRDSRMRRLLAREAARIMAEEGEGDFYRAKHRAAVRLQASNTRHLPRNEEIEQALVDYQRLFFGEDQHALVQQLRRVALEAMAFFQAFQPRLTGPVLRGTATVHSPVTLHLFADTPEEVSVFLLNNNIPFAHHEQSFTLMSGAAGTALAFSVAANDVDMELVVFPTTWISRPLRSPVDGRAERRAPAREVRALLEECDDKGG
ncbi:MAG TPA: hypothetical protein ENJ19_05850 [Gammaproteobacteria bacterium]|nr:hypothetical protein [Gammaproteobacteria bacterium]